MSAKVAKARDRFGNFGFVLAAAGSAIGLGNIWKFPYIAYENEGGSFVVVYLLAILLIGAPIMLAEVVIGRRTEQSPVGAFLALAKSSGTSKGWSWVGWLGILAGFTILSYYAVIAGWTAYYFVKCLGWSMSGFTPEIADSLGPSFGAFLANGWLQTGLQVFFIAITVGVVAMGVKGGIERTTKILMPVLFAVLVLLAVVSSRTAGFSEALNFLFHIGPITADGALEAIGHAFFTLSLGMGAMITYGSYVSRRQSLPRAAVTICFLDTLIALLASLIMFSIIFSVPEAAREETFTKSATILFTTLPRMFYAMPGGAILSPVFYLLVSFAALTSTISLLEVIVSYFIDVKGWARRKATVFVGALICLFGVPSALSLGASSFFSDLTFKGNGGFLSIVDYLASNWFLPLGGLGIALFTGWWLAKNLSRDEIEIGHGKFALYGVWLFLLRFVCPLAIGWIIWAVLGGRSFA